MRELHEVLRARIGVGACIEQDDNGDGKGDCDLLNKDEGAECDNGLCIENATCQAGICSGDAKPRSAK